MQTPLPVPHVTDVDLAFGSIDHMPSYKSLPQEFQDWHNHPFCAAVSTWFMTGTHAATNGIRIGDTVYTAKEGVKAGSALAAIKAVLASWSPKHEHKIAACGYMLHQWFDASPADGKAA